MNLVALLLAALVAAEPAPLPVTAVEGLGSAAVLVNPALLGFQPGLAWGVVASGDRDAGSGLLSLSTQLFGRLTPALVAGGFGQRSPAPAVTSSLGLGALGGQGSSALGAKSAARVGRVGGRMGGGVGVALGPLAAVGISGEGLVGDPDASFDGAARVLVGLALRPTAWLALGATFEDGSSADGLWIGRRAVSGAVGVRPLGRWLELDGSVTARDGVGVPEWLAKLQVNLWSGLVIAPFAAGVGGRELRWGGWLGVRLERVAALAGGSADTDLHGPQAHLWLSGSDQPQEPHLRRGGRTLVARLSDPRFAGVAGVVRFEAALRAALRDPGVATLAFRAGEVDWPLSDTLEVAGLLRQAREHGQKLTFFLDGGNTKTLLLLAANDAVTLHPGAVFEVLGARLTGLYLAELLDTLGVRAEFVTIGRYKTAPEILTRREASPDARAEYEAWIRSLDALVAERWDAGLGPLDGVRGRGLLAAETLAPRLVGATTRAFPAWWDDLRRVDELPADPPALDGTWGSRRVVAVLPIDGYLTGGESARLPFVGLHTSGAVDVVRDLQQAADDPDVVAIVLRANSGGGSAQAAEEIHAWIARVKTRKPVWVSISGLCASGCLYLAAAADHIAAERGALIGSIGIFAGKVDLQGLIGKLGVAVQEFGDDTHGRELFGLTRPFSDAERATLQLAMEAGYRLFKGHVAAHGAVPRLDEIADGRMVESAEAKALGLIDEVAGLPELLERLDERYGGGLDVRLPEPPGLLERLEKLQRLLATLGNWQVYHVGPLVGGP